MNTTSDEDLGRRVEDLVGRYGATELTRRLGITFPSLKAIRQGKDRIDSCSVYPIIEMVETGATDEELEALDAADVSQEIKSLLISARLKVSELCSAAGVGPSTMHNWMTKSIPRSKRTRVAFIRSLGRQITAAQNEASHERDD